MKTALIIALFALLTVSVFAGSKCGGNCPGGRCPSCPCGQSARRENAAQWCAKFSGWNQKCCQCIIHHESGGNGNSMNYNTNGSFDVGLWQINKVNWKLCGSAPPCNTKANFECAKKVWAIGGKSFRLWSTSKACGHC